jgi:hypothetical protein
MPIALGQTRRKYLRGLDFVPLPFVRPSSAYIARCRPVPGVHGGGEEPGQTRNKRRRLEKIWGGAEVRQSAGMGPENRWSPANTRLAQANKREAWQTWQSKSHHVPSRIVDSSIAQRFFVFGPEPVMTLWLIEAH